MKQITCDRCRGLGHDKNSTPSVKFSLVEQPDGTSLRKHTTLKRGSGCMKCLGLGLVVVL